MHWNFIFKTFFN